MLSALDRGLVDAQIEGTAVTALMIGGLANQRALDIVRYADDFVVLARTQERILQAELEVVNLLDSLGLMMNTEKTQITNFERGFRFLGHGFLENAIFPVDANQAKLKSGIEEKQAKKTAKDSSKKKVSKNISPNLLFPRMEA